MPPTAVDLPSPVLPVTGLFTFAPTNTAAVSKLAHQMRNTTCSLDHLPTSLNKICLPALVPSITAIINTSLSTGIVLKHAALTPVLKKVGANQSKLSNFRPISNLPFLAKVLDSWNVSLANFNNT